MSRTYRKMRTKKEPKMVRQELRKNKGKWQESREQSSDMTEMSSVRYLETV